MEPVKADCFAPHGPVLDDGDVKLYHGDVRSVLPALPAGSAQTCVTSPPYWGLRDYGVDGQIGSEPTFEEFTDNMLEVARGIRHVLADDGTLWLNMGDSYSGGPRRDEDFNERWHGKAFGKKTTNATRPKRQISLSPKNLIGQPWRIALALQEDGWILRSCIVWHKPNAMPESVTDRPSNAHEFIFLMAKQPRYYYDVDATRKPQKTKGERHEGASAYREDHPSAWSVRSRKLHPKGTNLRNVWEVCTSPYPDAHFATFPEKLIEPCILAGAPEGGVVLDPFMGSGTTAAVARRLGRHAIGVELNEEYLRLAADRLGQQSLLAGGASDAR